VSLRSPVPPLLRRLSSDEYRPLPWRPADREALARFGDAAGEQARRVGLEPPTYVEDRRGTAAALRAIDAAAGGGFYALPAEAEVDAGTADACFGGGSGSVVIDVQTHLVNPARFDGPGAAALTGFLEMTDPERWSGGVDPARISAAEWAALVFGGSETAVALLTSLPGQEHENVLTNAEIAACREVVDRYAGTDRVLTHTIVHPNYGPREIEAMQAWRDDLRPSGWKVYTLWDPPETVPPGGMPTGWFLDDEAVGVPFLEQVRTLGPRIVCAHKGIGGPVPGAAPAGSDPRDVGPAATLFPDITFLVYHSGYEPDPQGEEGPHESDPGRGVSRLVASLADAGIGRGANVYAELGTTWFLMLRRPREAAHVLGKLLLAVGEDRIVWGTDSVWYGAPQPLIDAFRAFTIPERLQEAHGYPPLTAAAKDKILGLNAAAVYGVDLAAARASRDAGREWLDTARRELGARLA
jgi:predicted TIM-barrel fold metal-dependent hydrolase